MTAVLTLSRNPTPTPAVPAPLAAVVAAQQADELPVGQLPTAEVGKLFNRLLSRAALLLGHKTWQDNAELFALASACAETVQRRFAGFKPGEIGLAFDRGVAGDYRTDPKEVIYVQLPTVTAWLYAYQTTARHQATKALRKAEESALQLDAPVRDVAGEVAELVRLAGAGSLAPAAELDFGNVLYDWLKARGCFRDGWWPDGPPDYATMRVEETDALLADNPSDTESRRTRTGFLNELLAGNWPAGHPLARNVANSCKKRVLREWVLQHAANESDVPALLAQYAAPATE